MSGRPLSPEEAAVWRKLVATVEPLKAVKNEVEPSRSLGPSAKPLPTHSNGSPTPTSREQEQYSTTLETSKEAFAQMLDRRSVARSPSEQQFNYNLVSAAKPSPVERMGNLDGHWERRLNKGQVSPDMTIDLHGHNLASAYARMDGALAQASAGQMRMLLLITGKARPAGNEGDGRPRGAIRRAMQDWLSASRHAANIAAVRNAHPRHGGDGALYIILRRQRRP